jgi:small subunit ribosomal protein S21
MAEVKLQEGESIESALRRFKRKVQQEDIIKDIKKHSFYLKPGDKRRAKQALAASVIARRCAARPSKYAGASGVLGEAPVIDYGRLSLLFVSEYRRRGPSEWKSSNAP